MKRYLTAILLVLGALVLLTAPVASAGLYPPTMRGYAFTDWDNFHRPLANIRVTIYDGNGDIWGSGYTDEDGYWPSFLDEEWPNGAVVVDPIVNPYRVLFEDPTGYWRSEWYSDPNGPDYAATWAEATPIWVSMGAYYETPEDLIPAPSDTTPPVTTTDYDGLWHNSSLTVTLSATDEGGSGMTGGLAKTEYSRDLGETWVEGTVVEFPLAPDGEGSGVHPLLYRSTDAAGNVETAERVDVRLDGRPPVTTDDAPLEPQYGEVSVHLTAADDLSGVAATWYSLDGLTWTEGDAVVIARLRGKVKTATLRYYSVDVAGNAEEVRTCTVTFLAGKDKTVLASAKGSLRGLLR